jgi:uncharacterized phiE125 gp8 family phage protein
MFATVIVPPADPVVTLAEAKAHLRVEHDDDDALITGLIAAATQNLDGPGGWLGRCLMLQTIEVTLGVFPCEPYELPYPPFVEVVSVNYYDFAGNDLVVDPGAYRTIGNRWISPLYGKSWPSTRYDNEGVRIRYTAGTEIAADVPEPIRIAILLMVAHLYEHRGEMVDASLARDKTAAFLLAPYRNWGAL